MSSVADPPLLFDFGSSFTTITSGFLRKGRNEITLIWCKNLKIPRLSVNILTTNRERKEGMFQTIIGTISSFMYSKLLVILLIGAGCIYSSNKISTGKII